MTYQKFRGGLWSFVLSMPLSAGGDDTVTSWYRVVKGTPARRVKTQRGHTDPAGACIVMCVYVMITLDDFVLHGAYLDQKKN